ncbi:MAG TPA: DUF885 domain-containing protein [Kofleriaceae bacterium]|jgi:uncharacterized protein (DUF885 family)|nr:DUF885 domain-containing protein [Kofleriaceae bacterium]
MVRTVLLCSLLAACGGSAPSAQVPGAAAGAATAPSAADQSFGHFVDEFFDADARFSPTSAVGDGFHAHDAEIEDRSASRIGQRVAELHAFQDRLAGIDRSALGFDNAIDAEALAARIRGELLSLETLKLWAANPMMYAGLPGGAVDALIKRDFAPKHDRLRSMVTRLRGVPAIFEAARANVVDPPKEFTDVAIARARGTSGFLAGAVATWAHDAAGGDAALLAEFEAANAAAIAASRSFADWLERDLLPRSHGNYALGEARFLELLRDEEMVELPLADLLAKGEANLKKDREAFVATARLIDPKRTASQVMTLLGDTHPTADDLIPAVGRSLEAARQFVVDKDLVTIPSEVRPKVEPTPPYARGTGFASMDTPGAFETHATEAFYYVEPVEPEWDAKHKDEHLRLFNPFVVGLINVHEAFPGHYVQFLYSPKFPTKTRKLTGAGTNAEGWAHYAEQMMVDHGFGNGDPRTRLAQLEEALLRDCRYVVGIKLHTQGMTVADGAKLFVDQCFQEPAVAYVEARRGTFNPTYLYYTLGKLEIQELAADYMRDKKATLKQFHDAFIAQGALPIPLVRRILLTRR